SRNPHVAEGLHRHRLDFRRQVAFLADEVKSTPADVASYAADDQRRESNNSAGDYSREKRNDEEDSAYNTIELPNSDQDLGEIGAPRLPAQLDSHCSAVPRTVSPPSSSTAFPAAEKPATPTLRIRFEGSGARYTARAFKLPHQRHDFEPMPLDDSVLRIPKDSLFFNDRHRHRREKVTLDKASMWGSDSLRVDHGLPFARVITTSQFRYCLRFVFNAEKVVSRKRSKHYEALTRLGKDAELYSTSLHALAQEGRFVPLHYGMWIMNTGAWAGKVIFSITQWCGVSWNELSRTDLDTEANRILVGRTFEDLHDCGVDFGGVSGAFVFRQVMLDIEDPNLTRDDILNGGAACYITGYSEAIIGHNCMRRLPILPLGSYIPSEEVGCHEIAQVLLLIGFMDDDDDTDDTNKRVSPADAIKWHQDYSARFPKMRNGTVLMAQRAKLFPRALPLYEGEIETWFESDDEYARIFARKIWHEDQDSDLAPESPGSEVSGSGSEKSPEPESPDPSAVQTVTDKMKYVSFEENGVASAE
ncbi:hypothetical protein R3P38DRAFT_2834098, partial [Favolaschia claudopus]